ncbi:E3 ubiquitin ligase PQT3-like isoform X2 [Medicago truncatula]|nr:E3 ubiquitin ligase PQT3-like isoform X2 [Medicago truncatula]
MLIPKNTSVLIRRVPGRPCLPIVTEKKQEFENKVVETEPENSTLPADYTSSMQYPENLDWDEFGNDLYSIPDQLPVQSSTMIPDAPLTSKADEDSKIKALIDTPALDWQQQGSDFGAGRGFRRGAVGGRIGGGRGFGLERKTPPEGYVCHRCKVSGHFIQHCPTNGDSTFDIKKVRQPTGIPRSMLMVNPQGSYALQNGSVAVLKPNEAAFDKEMEGLSSTRSVGDLPPELHCPLCNNVMKDAVLTSKCCFKSFCDKCIRNYIMSKSACVCLATNILADDLLPNKTLRDAIHRILESGNSSTENAGSTYQVQDMLSSRCPQPKIPSPTSSATSKGEPKVSQVNEGMANIQEIVAERKEVSATQQVSEQVKIPRAAVVSEVTHESMSVKEPEPASQGSAKLVEEEVQQKLVPTDGGKKKKKKKVRMPANDLQWNSYMMQPIGLPPPSYNSYWNGMQRCLDGYMGPYAAPMTMMGYGLGPFDMPFAGGLPQDPFGMHGYVMPVHPPHRDFAEFNIGMNVPPPVMNMNREPVMNKNREDFEARNAILKKQENERRVERDLSKDREFGRDVSSVGDVSSSKPKAKSNPPSSNGYHHQHHRHQEEEPPRQRKLKSDRDYDSHERHHHHNNHRSESSEPTVDRKQKSSIFSRMSFPSEDEAAITKKRKNDASSSSPATSNGYYEVRRNNDDFDDCEGSDDDDRHFKRRRSRYESVDRRERQRR